MKLILLAVALLYGGLYSLHVLYDPSKLSADIEDRRQNPTYWPVVTGADIIETNEPCNGDYQYVHGKCRLTLLIYKKEGIKCKFLGTSRESKILECVYKPKRNYD